MCMHVRACEYRCTCMYVNVYACVYAGLPSLLSLLKPLKFCIILCLLSCVKFSLKLLGTKWVELGTVGVINSFLVQSTHSSLSLACGVLAVILLYSFLRNFEFCRLACRTLNAHFARRDFGSKIRVYFCSVSEALTCASGSLITFVACSQFSAGVQHLS